MAEIIEFIPNGDVHKFFHSEKGKVIHYIIYQYGLNKGEAEDCFQEGSIAVWKNIKEGKLTHDNLTGSLSTYLMRCCCNHATHIIEKSSKLIVDDVFLSTLRLDNSSQNNCEDQIKIEDEQLDLLCETIKNLPEPCYTILWNVYFNYHEVEKTLNDQETIMDAIAKMIGYTKTSLKSKKSQCMNKLKTKINSLLND